MPFVKITCCLHGNLMFVWELTVSYPYGPPYQRNLQQLAIEIFKVKIGIAPKIMNEIFTFVENNTYNLRSGMHLNRVNVHYPQYDTESIGSLGGKIWNLVPVHMKDLKALSTFKSQKNKWIPKDCPCRLCKVYVAQVSFF